MLEAKRKRLSEEQDSMDVDRVLLKTQPSSPTLTFLSEAGMNCTNSQSSHPTKRACAGNARVLKEADHIPGNTCIPAEVLDPVKSPPSRYVDFGAADLMSNNDTGGFDRERQDHKEEEMRRRDYTDKGDGITEEANDGLQNDDQVNGQERNDSHLEAPRQKRTKKPFEERLEELEAFKEKHGHVYVTMKHDKSLGKFCASMRSARCGTGATMAITEDRIKALDELGFNWGNKKKSFEERIEDLKAFKAKHGHVRVTLKQDKSLANFCDDIRCARRGTAKRRVITEDRSKALDELGFKWAPGNQVNSGGCRGEY